ncbi:MULTISPECIES: hypothetical protein [Mesorhizobium]|uniref:hypothetical protein n=1 Tax=Mesorhizobium TaxID=68287 RepID=UPI0015F2AFBC|nr:MULTISPECIES: hypothetical protein [Mesorhizobium]
MAIGRPEAIDAASPATAASAEDGSQATLLFREEWRRSRQGKKVDRRHCRIGDRGVADLRSDQAIDEAVLERSTCTMTSSENMATNVHFE